MLPPGKTETDALRIVAGIVAVTYRQLGYDHAFTRDRVRHGLRLAADPQTPMSEICTTRDGKTVLSIAGMFRQVQGEYGADLTDLYTQERWAAIVFAELERLI